MEFRNELGVSYLRYSERQSLRRHRQPERSYNAAFYYEKHNLQARIAWNYQDERRRSLEGDVDEDEDEDEWDDTREFTDIQASMGFLLKEKPREGISPQKEWDAPSQENEE